MTNDKPSLDWSKAEESMVREIVSRGEAYMSAQLQAAIAADQRAMTLAGIFIATTTAVTGATLAVATSAQMQISSLTCAGTLCAIFLFAASVLCAWSARPVPFYFPGNEPENWYPARLGDFKAALGGEAENCQARIASNAKTLRDNGRVVTAGLVSAFLSPIAAVAGWFFH